MDTITREIERALDAGLYYLAVMLTLSLPDICAALETPTGATSGKTGTLYQAWCATWFTSYPTLTSLDLYSMRCGVLHQGKLGHPNLGYDRILFTFPGAASGFLHNNVMQIAGQGALNLDAPVFCRDMMRSVEAWYAAKKADVNVVANLPRLVQLYENGLAPFIVGVPVIA